MYAITKSVCCSYSTLQLCALLGNLTSCDTTIIIRGRIDQSMRERAVIVSVVNDPIPIPPCSIDRQWGILSCIPGWSDISESASPWSMIPFYAQYYKHTIEERAEILIDHVLDVTDMVSVVQHAWWKFLQWILIITYRRLVTVDSLLNF